MKTMVVVISILASVVAGIFIAGLLALALASGSTSSSAKDVRLTACTNDQGSLRADFIATNSASEPRDYWVAVEVRSGADVLATSGGSLLLASQLGPGVSQETTITLTYATPEYVGKPVTCHYELRGM